METDINNILVSIVICTYNRAKYLEKCLLALANQNPVPDAFEIIIINNNSNDETESIALNYTAENKNFKLALEKTQGLSHARNRAIKESAGKWICFIDDDAIPFPNYIEELVFLLKNYDFDCIGGPGIPIYNEAPPKWFNKNQNLIIKEKEIAELHASQFVDGFNCIFKKTILIAFGGFDPKLGMNGNNIGYGEETLIQIQIRKSNGKIGYDPNLMVYHLVDKYKLKLGWYFLSQYANGRDHWRTFNEQPKLVHLISLFFNAIYSVFATAFKQLLKLVKPDYYFQNYLIDIGSYNMRKMGMVVSGLMILLGKDTKSNLF